LATNRPLWIVLGYGKHQQYVLRHTFCDVLQAYRPVEGHAESCGRSHGVIESSTFGFLVLWFRTLFIARSLSNITLAVCQGTCKDDLSEVVREGSFTHCVMWLVDTTWKNLTSSATRQAYVTSRIDLHALASISNYVHLTVALLLCGANVQNSGDFRLLHDQDVHVCVYI
jgi:hypothetical protein